MRIFFIHAITDCYFALQMRMSVKMVLLLADYKRSVKIPQGFTIAHALLAVLSPRKETAKILMSVKGKFATRMPSVITPQGAFIVIARMVMKAMATRNALTLMNAKMVLRRY